jgi:hypothetical protein
MQRWRLELQLGTVGWLFKHRRAHDRANQCQVVDSVAIRRRKRKTKKGPIVADRAMKVLGEDA